MSNIFDALKKAKNEQVDKLFRPTSKENAARVPKYFTTLPHPAQSKPDAVDEESIEEAAIVQPAISVPAASVPPPPQPQLIPVPSVNHPQVTLRADRGNLVVLGDRSLANEQFAILRAKLIVAARKQEVRTICVTSSVTGEGKTFVATNLALALATESERGVVIVDADLRKPAVHRTFGIRDMTGLADFLQSERANIDSIIVDTDKRLACIPAGRIPNNPLPLLDSEKMKWLIGELRKRYDFIIIDSPPTAPLADTDILASVADGLLFVIRAGQTPLTIIQRSLKMLGKHAILGTVLNGTKEVQSYGYYYGQR